MSQQAGANLEYRIMDSPVGGCLNLHLGLRFALIAHATTPHQTMSAPRGARACSRHVRILNQLEGALSLPEPSQQRPPHINASGPEVMEPTNSSSGASAVCASWAACSAASCRHRNRYLKHLKRRMFPCSDVFAAPIRISALWNQLSI